VCRVAVIFGLLALVAAALPAAVSGASWSAPVTVSSSSLFVENPVIEFDETSRGFAAWRWIEGIGPGARTGVRTAGLTGPGSFAPEQAVPDPLSRPIAYGFRHVLWVGEEGVSKRGRQLTRLKIAFGPANGPIGALKTIDTAEVSGAAADVNASGQIALANIATNRGRGRRARLFVSRGKRLGRPRTVSRRGGVNAITVAVGPGGDIVVAWERGGRIEARIRRPGRRLGPVIAVGRGVKGGTQLRAAIAATGRAWIGWSSQNPAEGGTGPLTMRIAVSARKGSKFGRPRLLDRFERSAIEEATFDLSLDVEGRAFVAWSSFDGQNARARLASLNRRGRSARFTTLSQPGYDAAVNDLATGRLGEEALVVWSRLDAVGELGTTILAGYVPSSGAYDGEEQVSTGDRARKPAVAFNPESGLPTVVWSQREGPDGPDVPLEQIRTFLRGSTRTP
jgi:hypothetical protein